MYSENQEWMEGLDIDYQCGISPARARDVFKIALAANANDELFQEYSKQLQDKTWRIASVENTGFEVTEIVSPTNTAQTLYAQGQYADLKIVGKVKAKTWVGPSREDEDLTEEEEAAMAQMTPEIREYEFWIEEELSQKLFVGIKFDATVTQLSFGVSYFDAITGVHCSFYQLLPNEMMAGWREPEKEWLPMKQKNMLAQPTGGEFDEGFEDEEAQIVDNRVAPKADAEKKFPDGEDKGPKTEESAGDSFTETGPNVESEDIKKAMDKFEEKPREDHDVEVRKIGGTFIDVPGNPSKVFEQTFDVETLP